MSFINRLLNRPVVLDLYTSRREVMEFSSPVKAAKVFPEWWLNLPKQTPATSETGAQNTMKSCVGFTELFRRGIVLPMWSDLRCTVGEIGNLYVQWEHADLKAALDIHPQSQRGEYLPEERYQHLKLASPWLAKCSDDISWLMVQPTWNFDRPEKVVIPPGIVDFTHQPATNVNLFIPKSEQPETVSIEQGQPMVQFIPLTERRVEYRKHLVTPEEYEELIMPRLWFANAYRKGKKLKRSCPMGGAIK